MVSGVAGSVMDFLFFFFSFSFRYVFFFGLLLASFYHRRNDHKPITYNLPFFKRTIDTLVNLIWLEGCWIGILQVRPRRKVPISQQSEIHTAR